MRIPIKLVVEVDAEVWREANGLPDCRAKTVAGDVRSYVLNHVQQASIIVDECGGTVDLCR